MNHTACDAKVVRHADQMTSYKKLLYFTQICACRIFAETVLRVPCRQHRLRARVQLVSMETDAKMVRVLDVMILSNHIMQQSCSIQPCTVCRCAVMQHSAMNSVQVCSQLRQGVGHCFRLLQPESLRERRLSAPGTRLLLHVQFGIYRSYL